MTKQPNFRHDFLNESDELNYLSDLIRFHIRSGHVPPMEAESWLRRFHDLLAHAGLDDGSIILQDHWALLHESEGRIAQAIEHREREIQLIERLFSIGGPVGPINRRFLRQTLYTLHQDYLRVGDTGRANAVLQRIEALGKR